MHAIIIGVLLLLFPYETFLDSFLANSVSPSFELLSFCTYCPLQHSHCNYLFTHLFALLEYELLKAWLLSYSLPNTLLAQCRREIFWIKSTERVAFIVHGQTACVKTQSPQESLVHLGPAGRVRGGQRCMVRGGKNLRDDAGKVGRPRWPCYAVDFISRAMGNNRGAFSRGVMWLDLFQKGPWVKCGQWIGGRVEQGPD